MSAHSGAVNLCAVPTTGGDTAAETASEAAAPAADEPPMLSVVTVEDKPAAGDTSENGSDERRTSDDANG